MVEKHTVQGTCPLDCPDTCAWQAHVEDGKVVRAGLQLEELIESFVAGTAPQRTRRRPRSSAGPRSSRRTTGGAAAR